MDKPALLYTSYLSIATVTATDSYAGTTPEAILTATADYYHRPADTTGTKIYTIDLGESRVVDSLALVGEGLDGVVLTLRGSTDNFVSSNVLLLDAVNLTAPVDAAWSAFTAGAYRYFKVEVSAFGSYYRLAWVCLCDRQTLPFLAEDWDGDNISETGEPLVSADGLYLGSNQQGVMGELTLDWGTVTEMEYAALKSWRDACFKTHRPFVFVPDAAASLCYFGWVEKAKWSAPYKGGMREVAPVIMTTRVG